MEPLFESRNDIGKGVYIATGFEPPGGKGNTLLVLRGGTKALRRAIFDHLEPPYPPHARHLVDEEQILISRARRALYREATARLTTTLTDAAYELLPSEEIVCRSSRTNEMGIIPTVPRNQRMIMLRISRGGDRPCFLAEEHLFWWVAELSYLQAGSQRRKKESGMTVEELTFKGRADLNGATLFVLEQALATGTTAITVTREFLKLCRGQPRRIIFAAINGCTEGIRALKSAFKDSLVFVAVLHRGLNEKGYLVGIGCGDVGQMDAGVPDEISFQQNRP